MIIIRDVENNEKPFVYFSGDQGPGQVIIKTIINLPTLLNYLVNALAEKLNMLGEIQIDCIAGDEMMGPSLNLANRLSELKGYEISLVSTSTSPSNKLNDTLKVTSYKKNKCCLVFEELVDYDNIDATIAVVSNLREKKYQVNYVCTFLHNDNQKSERLKAIGVKLISLINLFEVLEVARIYHFIDPKLIDSYLLFLNNRVQWQLKYAMPIPETALTEVKRQKLIYRLLDKSAALATGAPRCKIQEGMIYYKVIPLSKLFISIVASASDNYSSDDEQDVEDGQDSPSYMKYYDIIKGLSPNIGVKFNLDFILLEDYDLILNKLGINQGTHVPVFCDLKLTDDLQTTKNMVQWCIDTRVSIVSVYHTIPKYYLTELVKMTRETKTRLYVVTILSYHDEEYCQEIYNKSKNECVQTFGQIAYDCGADGIILPADLICLDAVRDLPIEKMCQINTSTNTSTEVTPGQRAALLLPARERHAPFANRRFQRLGEGLDRRQQARVIDGLPDEILVPLRIVIAQVVAQHFGEQKRILRHQHDLLAQLRQAECAHVPAIDEQRAGWRVEQPHQHAQQGGLA